MQMELLYLNLTLYFGQEMLIQFLTKTRKTAGNMGLAQAGLTNMGCTKIFLFGCSQGLG